jgi:uncharacterized protein
MATILITGGSGMVGRRLTQALLAEGHQVRWLSRGTEQAPGATVFRWDVAQGELDVRALEEVDHIVHLSGAPIADKRWTHARMRELYSSRVDTAGLLLQRVRTSGLTPKSFISASGINYYGTFTSDRILVETDPPGDDTVGRLTQAWEQAADAWSPLCRVVKLRTSMVLAREGGALPKLAAPVRYGLGAPLGSGRQWVPWVHIDDLVDAYRSAITNTTMHGAFNVVAPEHVTNAMLLRGIANTLSKPFFLPHVPGFALRLALGRMAALILEGTRASSIGPEGHVISYRYPSLGPALEDLLR